MKSKKNILLIITVLALAVSFVLANSRGAAAAEENNLFTSDAFKQTFFKEDSSRPGTFSNGAVITGSENFKTPGLTKNYTFSGHVKIVEIGEQPWNGLRIIIGSSSAGSDKLVITKSMDTRLEFRQSNVNDAVYNAVPLPLENGTEFDYKIERSGNDVVMFLNGQQQLSLTIDQSLDTFDQEEGYNLGFEASECNVEISDITVTCSDISQSGDEPETGDGEELINLFNKEDNFTGLIFEDGDGVYTNGEINSNSETFFCPYLTTDFTYSGHIKIIEIGEQAWNGVRIIFGLGNAGTDEFLITKDWGTRLNFCGNNMNDAFYNRVSLTLTEGTEFDFKVVRKGDSVSLYLNGINQCTLTLDEESDAFDSEGDYNLGFALSDCHFEASELCVYCKEAQERLSAEKTTAAPTEIPSETVTEAPTEAPTEIPLTSAPEVQNGDTDNGSSVSPVIIIIGAVCAAALIGAIVFAVIRKKGAKK